VENFISYNHAKKSNKKKSKVQFVKKRKTTRKKAPNKKEIKI